MTRTVILALLALYPLTALADETIKSMAMNGQQYAVLKSFIASGQRNVRWETTPLKYTDRNSKPIDAQKTAGKKQADSSMAFGCVDIQGQERANGDTYKRPNDRFKYRCNNGAEEVTACVGSDRTNKAVIPVGETLDVNGFWHKCQSFPNGSVVYTQETACKYCDKEYHIGEEINIGFHRVECQESGYKVVGCYYLDDNGNAVKLNAGETKEAGKHTHYCKNKNNTIQYFSKTSGCAKVSKKYKEGDTFSQNHLSYKCVNGVVDITGCYIDESRPLKIGQDVVEQNVAHRCYRIGDKIEYSEYACGQQGTSSCQLEPIPQTPDDAPTLARGLKAPGFATFAIAQIDGGQLADSSTLKLELNKLLMRHAPQ